MTAAIELPPRPDRELLAQLCRETAERERLQPLVVEKDFILTRLLWALGQDLGEHALLKGGTLLSKVDLGFRRMSEDADLVVPGTASRTKRSNVLALNQVRDALRRVAESVGVQLQFPDGEHFDRGPIGNGTSAMSPRWRGLRSPSESRLRYVRASGLRGVSSFGSC